MLNDLSKNIEFERGYIAYFGKTWKDGTHNGIATYSSEDFERAYADHSYNKACCDDDKISENCYYYAFFGKILKKGVVCLIDAYAVEN